MAIEKTLTLGSPVVTAIVFNTATSSFSQFTAEEVIEPSGADAQKALDVIRLWEVAEASISGDNKHMPALSRVLHNSLVDTKGYKSSIVEVTSNLPDYPNGFLETKITADYVLVTSVISEAEQKHLLQAPRSETTSTALQVATGPVKLWQDPKQAVHTIGFSLEQPKMLEEVSHSPEGVSNEWFSQVLKPTA